MTAHNNDFLNLNEASLWASEYLGKNVTTSNISYLIQYGRIRKNSSNGSTLVSRNELIHYYKSFNSKREISWKNRLGGDLNWALSFDQYKEAETTKHVHRLHPYKGKFIPQLVEYFLDTHTDTFKTASYFKKGDIILDPFSGSGTTLVQANELGYHAIGVDISMFNALISNCKVANYDLFAVLLEIERITKALKAFLSDSRVLEFEENLLKSLYAFNNTYFPVPDYKYRVRKGLVDETKYGAEKEKDFLPVYYELVKKYRMQLRQDTQDTFLDKWYSKHIRDEIEFVFEEINKVKENTLKNILCVVLSRTIRSCRATTHADLATLLEPITAPYYCSKHGKICKPLFSILKWWETYSKDTVARLEEFHRIRTNTYQYCLTGDSRTIDIPNELERTNSVFANLVRKNKINGIFSSPPYVGLINYHEQHAYAYDLFGFKRQDALEIGPLFKGQGKEAKQSYIQGISEVLNNCKKYMIDDCNIFLVANDKYNLYPSIAENTDMNIINQYKRPVLNRTEKDKGAYSETIFHFRRK